MNRIVKTHKPPMRNFRRDEEAVRELSPEQFRVTQRGSTECPGTGRVPAQRGTGHLRRRRLRRAAVRFVGQIRLGLRLAELHPAHRPRQRQRSPRHDARYDGHRGAIDARRQPSRPCISGRAAGPRRIALLHQLRGASVHPSRRYGGRGLCGLPEPGAGRPMTHQRGELT